MHVRHPYLFSSAPLDIERLASGARGHSGVESMHWLLDVEFKDDLSRYRDLFVIARNSAFAYKGKQSWVFVSVSYSSMPSGNYTVMLDDAEGSHVVGTIKVADGHGVLGAPAPGSAGTANGVRLVNNDGQLMCEALFTS